MKGRSKSIGGFFGAKYPMDISWNHALITAFLSGLFVGLFLIVFQPFGLSAADWEHKTRDLASYGIPSFVVVLMVNAILLVIGTGAQWKVWQVCLFFVTILILITGANALWGAWLFDECCNWSSVSTMLIQTVAIGFFPVVGTVAYQRMRLVHRHEGVAEDLNARISLDAEAPRRSMAYPVPSGVADVPDVIRLTGENRGESLDLIRESFYFVEASANYVEVVWKSPDGKMIRTMLRAPLKSIETQLEVWSPTVMRCHRSFVVNRSKVIRAEGNALGLTLSMEDDFLTVPVSRTFVREFAAVRGREA